MIDISYKDRVYRPINHNIVNGKLMAIVHSCNGDFSLLQINTLRQLVACSKGKDVPWFEDLNNELQRRGLSQMERIDKNKTQETPKVATEVETQEVESFKPEYAEV